VIVAESALGWFTLCDLIFTVVQQHLQQRRKGKSAMFKLLSLPPMIKGSGLGMMCISGGVLYCLGGLWLGASGIPAEFYGIQVTHLLRMMWAAGTTCGLMGLAVFGAFATRRIVRAAAWFSGIGLAIITFEALVAMVNYSPVVAFAESALPFSSLWQALPMISWGILCIEVVRANLWRGWSRFAPLGTLFAPIIGLVLGQWLGIRYLPIVVMGLALVLLGVAVQKQLIVTRRALYPALAPM
jgi:hypothetical protein